MSMSIPYEATGRTRQKARTRAALVAAADALLAQGTAPTVEQSADAASIARATAYRYFPNQRALLAATYPEIETTSLLGDNAPPDDVEARLDHVARSMGRQMLRHESALRAMLRLSLGDEPGDLPLRQGRRITWVDDALSPLRERLPATEYRRLVHAVAAGLGIEAFVWLTDMAGLSRKQAAEVMRWKALALLRGALSP